MKRNFLSVFLILQVHSASLGYLRDHVDREISLKQEVERSALRERGTPRRHTVHDHGCQEPGVGLVFVIKIHFKFHSFRARDTFP